MATTHPALLFLLVLACAVAAATARGFYLAAATSTAAREFYLPAAAPTDFRKNDLLS